MSVEMCSMLMGKKLPGSRSNPTGQRQLTQPMVALKPWQDMFECASLGYIKKLQTTKSDMNIRVSISQELAPTKACA